MIFLHFFQDLERPMAGEKKPPPGEISQGSFAATLS
jgi:hypothetical protein